MATRKSETEGRNLNTIKVEDFDLLSDEKLERVFNFLDGITPPINDEEKRLLALCSKMPREKAVLALYDRLGGGVKKDGRKVALGTFYDFAARAPKEKIELGEESFDDTYVLVRKERKEKREKGGDIKKKAAELNRSKPKKEKKADELGQLSEPRKGRKPKDE
ncbi:MAG: hypothetical protein AAB456_04175 [Patescibacteria group bacterium]